ncbi:MAG: beta-lactamase family protein [Steroidobacteraceae bacterium]|nr:beta-lactamase family protein [Steroidobacteraceae bacterium]
MHRNFRAGLTALCLALSLGACGGGGDGGGGGTSPPPTVDAFAEVDRLAAATFARQAIPGMGLAIYDRNDRKVFEKMYGDFAPDRRVAVASASKMVSGLVIFRLIDQGFLSLDSTTAAVLGWTGPQGAITLRHLLSFTSGLPPGATCTSQAGITLADCVAQISALTPVAAPGTRFDYGSTHLQVAARMAEVVTGSSWNAIFAQQLGQPLRLPAAASYYTAPRLAAGTSNPLIAGGLRASMNEYASLLSVVFHHGTWEGQRLVAASLFEAQAREPFPDVVIGNSPMSALAFNFRYGLTAWLECATPATGCPVISSPGAFGWTPWVDLGGGYYAIIGMEVGDATDGVVNFSVQLAQDLKPAIRRALGT